MEARGIQTPMHTAAAQLVGRRVSKHFDGEGLFNGKVLAFSPTTNWFTVLYDDGDLEELTWRELNAIILSKEPKGGTKSVPAPMNDIEQQAKEDALKTMPPSCPSVQKDAAHAQRTVETPEAEACSGRVRDESPSVACVRLEFSPNPSKIDS